MPCFGPLSAYYARDVNPSGKRSLVFDKRRSHSGIAIQVPCSKCIGCLLARSRQWAIRCMHEKRLHSASAFITLTYDDRNLPPLGSLVKRDVQLFMKRLRKVRPEGLRFFAVGEYGSTFRRPHYHVLLFNTDFPDIRFYKSSTAGDPLYRSKELSSLWPLGNADVGALTFASAAYCARYCVKKLNLDAVDARLAPEFRTMSNRPGIGYPWFLKHQIEAYKHDSVIMQAREIGIPRYYDTKYETVDKSHLLKLKRLRRIKARQNADDAPGRLRTRERFEELKFERFARDVS